MIGRLLEIIEKKYPISELDIKDFSALKAGGKKYTDS